MSARWIHEVLPVGWLQCNCSVVGDAETREALVLDPGDEVERILALLRKHSLQVKAIVSTHAHIDHVGGLKKLREATGAPVLLHGDDIPLYQAMPMQAAFIGMRPPEIVELDNLLRDGDTLRWGGFSAEVLHTPGHTPGSICLHMAGAPGPSAPAGKGARAPRQEDDSGVLFAGDTLFAGSIGRTDLWGGSFEEIMRSLKTRILALPDNTVVFPGHGPASTIGEERETNPFLAGHAG